MALQIDDLLSMSTADLLDIVTPKDLYNLSLRDLKKVTAKVQNVVNKRVTRLERRDYNTPALRSLEKSGGRLTTKKESKAQLINEITRGKMFLTAKTSTIKGAQLSQRRMAEVMGGEMTSEQTNTLWEAYNKIKEKYPSQYFDSNTTIEFLHNEIVDNPDISVDELIDRASEKIESEYEEYEPDTEDFFTI